MIGDGPSCPYEITDEERARYEAEGRRAAEDADPPPGGLLIFTDGLGGMGVGSWSDGPASIRQAAFSERYRKLHGEFRFDGSNY